MALFSKTLEKTLLGAKLLFVVEMIQQLWHSCNK